MIYFVIIFIIYIVSTFPVIRSYRLMLKKGYAKHHSLFICALFFIAQLFASFTLTAYIGLDYFGGIALFIYQLLIVTIVPMSLLLLAKSLKPRKREFGQRKYKPIWLVLGVIFLITALIIFVIGLIIFIKTWIHNDFESAMNEVSSLLKLILPSTLIATMFFNYEKLFQQKDIESVIKDDKRPPVLFIRSFSADTTPFFGGSIHKKDNLVSSDLLTFQNSKRSATLTFQQFFSKSFEENIGTLIGFGDPTRSIPLEGLSSSFYSDKNWQEVFMDLAQRAACIITLPGDTDGLNFELDYILRNDLSHKLFIFTPVYKLKFNFQKRLLWFSKWLWAVELVEWDLFCQKMKKIGYQIQNHNPGQGCVISFSKEGDQITLKKNAQLPFEFIEVVKKHIQPSNTTSGKDYYDKRK